VLRSRTLEEKAAAVQAFAREVVPLIEDGRLEPAIDSVFEVAGTGQVEAVHAAFDRLGERGKTGKVLLRFT
jgi:NADPH:quinone reductase